MTALLGRLLHHAHVPTRTDSEKREDPPGLSVGGFSLPVAGVAIGSRSQLPMTIPQETLERDGYALLPGVIARERVAALVSDLERAFRHAGPSVLASRGHV